MNPKKKRTAKKAAKKVDPWIRLAQLITKYADAAIDDSWKGGGDPDSIPVIEAQLQLAAAELTAHIALMKRTFE